MPGRSVILSTHGTLPAQGDARYWVVEPEQDRTEGWLPVPDDRNEQFWASYAEDETPVKRASRRVIATLLLIICLPAIVFGLSTALYGGGTLTMISGVTLVVLGIAGVVFALVYGKFRVGF